MTDELLTALVPVARALERLGVPFYIGGSVASSVHGAARSTMDVDIVADLQPSHTAPLVAALGDQYYADEQSIADAVAKRTSFNLIHYATSFKVDVFVATRDPFQRSSLSRRVTDTLATPESPDFPFASKEDTVLAKLDWFRKGGGVSERQWLDVQGVLQTQRRHLDLVYLRHWAAELRVADLLERALAEAGLG